MVAMALIVASSFAFADKNEQKELNKEPCDHTLKKTAQWLGEHCPPEKLEPILQEMRDMGGFCDCEVLLNWS